MSDSNVPIGTMADEQGEEFYNVHGDQVPVIEDVDRELAPFMKLFMEARSKTVDCSDDANYVLAVMFHSHAVGLLKRMQSKNVGGRGLAVSITQLEIAGYCMEHIALEVK